MKRLINWFAISGFHKSHFFRGKDFEIHSWIQIGHKCFNHRVKTYLSMDLREHFA